MATFPLIATTLSLIPLTVALCGLGLARLMGGR